MYTQYTIVIDQKLKFKIFLKLKICLYFSSDCPPLSLAAGSTGVHIHVRISTSFLDGQNKISDILIYIPKSNFTVNFKMQVVKLPSDKNLKIQNPLSYFTLLSFSLKINSDFLNEKATQSPATAFDPLVTTLMKPHQALPGLWQLAKTLGCPLPPFIPIVCVGPTSHMSSQAPPLEPPTARSHPQNTLTALMAGPAPPHTT